MSKALAALGLAAYLITAAPAVHAEKKYCGFIPIVKANLLEFYQSMEAVLELYTEQELKLYTEQGETPAMAKAEMKNTLNKAIRDIDRQKKNCINGYPPGLNPNCYRAMHRYGLQGKVVMQLREMVAKAEGEYYPLEDAYNKGFIDAPQAEIRSRKSDMEKKVKAWKAAQKKYDALYHAAIEEGYNPRASVRKKQCFSD